ncbi:MAG: hydroxymethylbilane synthase [Chloroflexota bacterium]|nr:hydroxymethylbilane synthase [Chloroflexota bacterium]MDE2886346.1 hydroxymethylbilane synthase [Chloroflexota bacterium]
MPRSITIGTRGSRLALTQARAVVDALASVSPGWDVGIETIASTGDEQPDAAIESLGLGVFTSAIEQALLDGRIDVAVHSLKDLPTSQPEGLTAVPVLERGDPRDVLIDRWNAALLDLPEGARIGTSSPRRAAQIAHGRKDILLMPIRGNVETRIGKVGGPDYDGVIVAAAGVERLGLAERIAERLSPHVCTPAPGQAALAAEARADDTEVLELLRQLVHEPTEAAVEAERALLRAAGSGCRLPLGAFAEVQGEQMRLFATVTPSDGSTSYRVEVTGSVSEPDLLGRAAYQAFLEQGASGLLRETGR